MQSLLDSSSLTLTRKSSEKEEINRERKRKKEEINRERKKKQIEKEREKRKKEGRCCSFH